ncbi:type 4a pilus biogenesis protein PilO [Patescibacteria group bacterium]|nr:type 4a pilus biogenesis protein PilO [Patescibacteria group bacterium]
MIEKKGEFNYKLFWNTRKELVLAILFFVISAMILFIGIISQIAPIRADLDQLKSHQAELDKFAEKSAQLQQLAADPNSNQFSAIDEVLPSHKPLLEILSNLNAVANNSEVIIKNFSLNPGEIATDTTKVKKSSSDQKYDYLDLDFSVSGALWKIQNFINLIEQVTPISTITNISISRNIDEDKNAQAQADLVLRTFYFTQPIKTTITSPLPIIAASERKIISSINELSPNNLEKQENVISGDRGNLFGIQNKTVEELEQELIQATESAETATEPTQIEQ